MRKFRRASSRLGLVGLVTGCVMALFSGTAYAGDVIHPDDLGPVTDYILPGSYIDLNGQIFNLGTAACVDGTDNDLDELVDADDPECDSETDGNERLDGVQEYETPNFTFNILDTAGNISATPDDIRFQQGEVVLSPPPNRNVLGLQIQAVGDQYGALDPEYEAGLPGYLSSSVSLIVRLSNLEGTLFQGLPETCAIGPINGELYSYDWYYQEQYMTLNGTDVPVPAVQPFGTYGCGSFAGLISSALRLPGNAQAFLMSYVSRVVRPGS